MRIAYVNTYFINNHSGGGFVHMGQNDVNALSEPIKTFLGNEDKRMTLRGAGLITVALKGNMLLEVDRLFGFYQKILLNKK
jgi:hypothetical protein